MWAFMLLLALTAIVRADQNCDACIAGRCHTRKTLLEGFSITDQLAIDRTKNILYTQINNNTIVAFLLDEGSVRKIVEKKTRKTFNQKNQRLYTSIRPFIVSAYKFGEDDDINLVTILDRDTTPVRLHYEDTLYIVNEDGSTAYYSTRSHEFAGYENLRDYKVTDMVNVKDITNWFFISDNQLYKYVLSDMGVESWHLMHENRHILSIGGHGDNYFLDPSKQAIFKLDRESGELKEYGTYQSGTVEDFVFDRDENIVFLDADRNVARWVPGPELCEIAPPGETYRVDEMSPYDDYVITLIRSNTSPPPASTEESEESYSSYEGDES